MEKYSPPDESVVPTLTGAPSPQEPGADDVQFQTPGAGGQDIPVTIANDPGQPGEPGEVEVHIPPQPTKMSTAGTGTDVSDIFNVPSTDPAPGEPDLPDEDLPEFQAQPNPGESAPERPSESRTHKLPPIDDHFIDPSDKPRQLPPIDDHLMVPSDVPDKREPIDDHVILPPPDDGPIRDLYPPEVDGSSSRNPFALIGCLILLLIISAAGVAAASAGVFNGLLHPSPSPSLTRPTVAPTSVTATPTNAMAATPTLAATPTVPAATATPSALQSPVETGATAVDLSNLVWHVELATTQSGGSTKCDYDVTADLFWTLPGAQPTDLGKYQQALAGMPVVITVAGPALGPTVTGTLGSTITNAIDLGHIGPTTAGATYTATLTQVGDRTMAVVSKPIANPCP